VSGPKVRKSESPEEAATDVSKKNNLNYIEEVSPESPKEAAISCPRNGILRCNIPEKTELFYFAQI